MWFTLDRLQHFVSAVETDRKTMSTTDNKPIQNARLHCRKEDWSVLQEKICSSCYYLNLKILGSTMTMPIGWRIFQSETSYTSLWELWNLWRIENSAPQESCTGDLFCRILSTLRNILSLTTSILLSSISTFQLWWLGRQTVSFLMTFMLERQLTHRFLACFLIFIKAKHNMS